MNPDTSGWGHCNAGSCGNSLLIGSIFSFFSSVNMKQGHSLKSEDGEEKCRESRGYNYHLREQEGNWGKEKDRLLETPQGQGS